MLRESLKNSCAPKIAVVVFMASINGYEVVGGRERNEGFHFAAIAAFGAVVCCYVMI